MNFSIQLAEPVLFVRGFELDGQANTDQTTTLRGKLVLSITKTTKLKMVILNFLGKSTTEWPEGIPSRCDAFSEEREIISHTWRFFDTSDAYETDQRISQSQEERPPSFLRFNIANASGHQTIHGLSSTCTGSRRSGERSFINGEADKIKEKRLLLQQRRTSGEANSQQRGYFQPGVYEYPFELQIPHTCPETIRVDHAHVKYNLEMLIGRASIFKRKIRHAKEVVIVRTPSLDSLDSVRPIAISRTYERILRYNLVISGNSFPIGSTIPISLKITPFSKVQFCGIAIYLSENVQYFCHEKRDHRRGLRHIWNLLRTGPNIPHSNTSASSNRQLDSDPRPCTKRGISSPDPVLGSEPNLSPSEFEWQVQLPTCTTMREQRGLARMHFDTTWDDIKIHHWIKIIIQLSTSDPEDPTGTKSKHSEISIESPFRILSCYAAQASTLLPVYSRLSSSGPTQAFECGCPDALRRGNLPPFELETPPPPFVSPPPEYEDVSRWLSFDR